MKTENPRIAVPNDDSRFDVYLQVNMTCKSIRIQQLSPRANPLPVNSLYEALQGRSTSHRPHCDADSQNTREGGGPTFPLEFASVGLKKCWEQPYAGRWARFAARSSHEIRFWPHRIDGLVPPASPEGYCTLESVLGQMTASAASGRHLTRKRDMLHYYQPRQRAEREGTGHG